jgi:hypothetical protein
MKERPSASLYILQPHSLELELASETGLVGLGLFSVFTALVGVALIRASSRRLGAAGLGMFVALLAQASVDRTWSFPGLVAPTLLVAGAAAGSVVPPRPRSGASIALAGIAGAALAGAFIVPYLADLERRDAAKLATRDPRAAWQKSNDALRLNPWDPDAVELQARLLESAGKFAIAAARYRRAAGLSLHPWLDEYLAARALGRAGANGAREDACRAAVDANPYEPIIVQGVCAGS